MRLVHYSDKHLTEVRSVSQAGNCKLFKPCGLWVSVDGERDWPEWCRAEEFQLERLACATEVVLSTSAKVLTISDVVALDAFHEAYVGDPLYPGSEIGYPNWSKVAEEYDAIIIAPYQYRRRLDGDASNWYYGWDCASGCIWNAGAVAEMRPSASPSPAAAPPPQDQIQEPSRTPGTRQP